MVIYANPLEGSKICWNTHLASQKVAHNDFGHGDNDNGDDDEDGDFMINDDNNISSHKSFVFIVKPNLFTFYVDGWTPHELWKQNVF